jgi:hypothetical protein
MIRIVGLSATLPNYRDVGAFLRVAPSGLFHFGPEFRFGKRGKGEGCLEGGARRRPSGRIACGGGPLTLVPSATSQHEQLPNSPTTHPAIRQHQ